MYSSVLSLLLLPFTKKTNKKKTKKNLTVRKPPLYMQ